MLQSLNCVFIILMSSSSFLSMRLGFVKAWSHHHHHHGRRYSVSSSRRAPVIRSPWITGATTSFSAPTATARIHRLTAFSSTTTTDHQSNEKIDTTATTTTTDNDSSSAAMYQELKWLSTEIRRHDDLYYNQQPQISDDDYHIGLLSTGAHQLEISQDS
jgi:hypothetical protein